MFTRHAKQDGHIEAYRRQNDRTQQALPSMLRPTLPDDSYGLDPSPTRLPVSMTDRTTHMEAQILAFIAEHNLPLNLSDPLVDLIKSCCRDAKAINEVCYYTFYGSLKRD